jgi:hypothetical protein
MIYYNEMLKGRLNARKQKQKSINQYFLKENILKYFLKFILK